MIFYTNELNLLKKLFKNKDEIIIIIINYNKVMQYFQ